MWAVDPELYLGIEEVDMDAIQDKRLRDVASGVSDLLGMIRGGNLPLSLIQGSGPKWYTLQLTDSGWLRRHVPNTRTAIIMGLDGPPKRVSDAKLARIKEGPAIPSLQA